MVEDPGKYRWSSYQINGLGKILLCVHHTRSMYESVDLIGFSFEVEAYEKFYHRHIVDIPRTKLFV